MPNLVINVLLLRKLRKGGWAWGGGGGGGGGGGPSEYAPPSVMEPPKTLVVIGLRKHLRLMMQMFRK